MQMQFLIKMLQESHPIGTHIYYTVLYPCLDIKTIKLGILYNLGAYLASGPFGPLFRKPPYIVITRGGEYAVNSHFGCLLLTANYLLLTALLTAKI